MTLILYSETYFSIVGKIIMKKNHDPKVIGYMKIRKLIYIDE